MRATVKGFAAGYNAYLRKTGRAKLPDPTCRGKALGAPDHGAGHVPALLPARPARQLGQLPRRDRRRQAAGRRRRRGDDGVVDPQAFAKRLDPTALGSNAYGIGSDGARGERSLVLGNPHFPWQGSERWYELHLTIPGKLDVIGAALQGVPAVNIGFNRGVAWSHTVSTARRFTPYELDLVKGDPTRLPGRTAAPVKMRKRTVRVRVRGGGTRRHTFYETRWGPVFSFTAAGLTWTAEHAYALADVNADNFRLLNQWAEYDKAQSVDGLRKAYRKVQGNPWVNTIAADSRGRAYYADESVVPNVDAALQRRCTADNPIAPLLLTQGVVLLDGSRAACRVEAPTATRSRAGSSARRACRG